MYVIVLYGLVSLLLVLKFAAHVLADLDWVDGLAPVLADLYHGALLVRIVAGHRVVSDAHTVTSVGQ